MNIVIFLRSFGISRRCLTYVPINFSKKLTSGVKKKAIKKPYINVIRIPLTAIRREPTVPKKPPILSRNLFKSIHKAKTAKLYDAILKYFLSNLGLRKIPRLL